MPVSAGPGSPATGAPTPQKSATDGAGSTRSGGSGLPCDVDQVLGTGCQQCHGASPSFGAPMPLVTYADLTAPSRSDPQKRVYEQVVARVHDDNRPMPPSPYARLTPQQAGVLDDWARSGAPSSDATCGGNGSDAGSASPAKPLSCTPDTFIRGASPFTMPSGATDIYMCYGFDVSAGQKRHVIGLAPKIDNKKIVHHLLLFQGSSSYSATPQECSGGLSAEWRLVTGWAPGGQNLELPPEAGFPQDSTTHWILQVHYNDASGQNVGQVDASGYDLCTTDQLRPNDADVMAFGTIKATLPPHATTDITCQYSPFGLPKVHIFGASPHMHKLGKAMSTSITSKGQTTKVVDQPNFDFNTQLGYAANADLAPGDTVSTRCVWNNSTDQTVSWGENTGDEMCFDFVQYYPKVTTPFWSWALPSATASCNPTQ